MAVKKNIRFEIFKRDDFRCQYCGMQVPDVVLEVDHIIPVCQGGSDSPDNLLTACFDCNRGKSGTSLKNKKLKSLAERKKQLKEESLQRKAYEEMMKEKYEEEHERLCQACDAIECALWGYDEEGDNLRVFTSNGKLSIKKYLQRLSIYEMIEAAEIASAKMYGKDPDVVCKYFYGICKNKISEKDGDFSGRIYSEIKNYYLSKERGSKYFKPHILKNICAKYPKDRIYQAIDEAFSESRNSYWKSFCWLLDREMEA